MNVRRAPLLLCLLLVACAGSGPYVWANSLPPEPVQTSRALQPGDRVHVIVSGQETMSGEFEVRPGGEIVVPFAGRIQAAGQTPEVLATVVRDSLRGVLEQPVVTVVLAGRRLNVSVIGEVRTPGRYELTHGEGVLDALARAGGLTPFADAEAVFVVRRRQESPRVRFRYSDLTTGAAASVRFQLKDGDVVVVE